MSKEQLDRIKKAYSSGLKVQIWFNGYWEDFDIRDYSMYSEPFSENRQYRIIGSDYADIAEKRITDLENKIADIKANCDLAIEGRDIKIKELEQENAELKEHHKSVCESLTNTHRNIREQLTKAKELLELFVQWNYGCCKEPDYKDIVKQAEQFLKEIEK